MATSSVEVSLPEPRMTAFGKVRADAVESTRVLPARAEVVIIGGGILGAMTAFWLARRKIDVLLVEKGEIGGEASGRAFGLVSNLLLDPLKMEMTLRAKALWAELRDEMGDTGFRQHGLTFFAYSGDELAHFEIWLQEVGGAGAMMLGSREVAQRYGTVPARVAGGIFSQTDGGVEPRLAAPAAARAAKRWGATVMTACAARGVETMGGAISAVVTERGTVLTRHVICAANVWARLFCGNFDLDIPQLAITQTIGRTARIPGGPPGAGGSRQGAWRRHLDGSYTIASTVGARLPLTRDTLAQIRPFLATFRENWSSGKLSFDADARTDWTYSKRWALDEITPFERRRVLDPLVDDAMNQRALQNLQCSVPAFQRALMIERWSGTLAITPDNMPTVSWVPAVPGLIFLSGSSYGMTWAPAMAEAATSLVTGETPSIDLNPFCFSRFGNGNIMTNRH